ncbi:hypothetical protein COL30_05150 [Bacillus pseudomycoides]|uniref:hypothetical protein n=1 Tax=Bacillus pseudomycoides TaxID=64104 RepID=UPI000BEDCB24|nr:hypothetical protein [Bacillus pseudomycoides]PEA84035.1 hypothetical protein CON99_08220 [Bacillus pseudomycoides]PEK26247.1 hypothetical protein CN693_09340 [Bacillus pseudomycoides]PEO14155.1 hypothetical protein CN542_18440 [Bacillus pseudomycoides]PEP60622.1 hypothetical protein CN591_19185 [Bacillus pseudomycoides]PFW67496.1 hypothetical protein COL25_16435 [Bacillus pseudomycoides]
MFSKKEVISFRSFMDQSYKRKKSVHLYSIGAISPFSFFHMSQPIANTYMALGILGGVTIGAVLLEKYLIRNNHVFSAKLVSDGLYYGMKLGRMGLISYVLIRIFIML